MPSLESRKIPWLILMFMEKPTERTFGGERVSIPDGEILEEILGNSVDDGNKDIFLQKEIFKKAVEVANHDETVRRALAHRAFHIARRWHSNTGLFESQKVKLCWNQGFVGMFSNPYHSKAFLGYAAQNFNVAVKSPVTGHHTLIIKSEIVENGTVFIGREKIKLEEFHEMHMTSQQGIKYANAVLKHLVKPLLP